MSVCGSFIYPLQIKYVLKANCPNTNLCCYSSCPEKYCPLKHVIVVVQAIPLAEFWIIWNDLAGSSLLCVRWRLLVCLVFLFMCLERNRCVFCVVGVRRVNGGFVLQQNHGTALSC